MNDTDTADFISTALDAQLKQQGVGVVSVSDGHVLLFKTETLEGLLEASKKSGIGKVLVHVKHQPIA